MNLITSLSPAQLRQAANLLENIQSLEKELYQILGATVESAPARAPKKGRGKISAAGLRNIRAAQKARWAKVRGAAPGRKLSAKGLANIRAGVAKRMAAQVKSGQKRKVQRSAAWRAALSAVAKARWAKAKAAGKTKL